LQFHHQITLYVIYNFTGKPDFQTVLEHLLGKNHAMNMKLLYLALFSIAQDFVEQNNSTLTDYSKS